MQNKWKILIIFGVFIFFAAISVILAVMLIGDSDFSAITAGEVAVIPLKGEITEYSVGEVWVMLNGALNDNAVKAIVLDIDSPGGEAYAGREFMYKVKSANGNGTGKKPIVARIGSVGASGAYHIASATEVIVASEDSITGSLGVVMTLMQYHELLDKLGINVKVITSGERKDIGSPYRNMTEDEEQRLQEIVNKIYEHFISDIAVNRNMSLSEVRKLATGDIYLGSEAYDKGLVDKLGNLDDAIEIAAELGGIKGEPRVKYVRREPTFYDIFAEGTTNIGYGIGKAFLEVDRPGEDIKLKI